MIGQYLVDEGLYTSNMTLMDEAAIKSKEMDEVSQDVKSIKKFILDGEWAEVDKLCSKVLNKNQKSFLFQVYKQQYLVYFCRLLQ